MYKLQGKSKYGWQDVRDYSKKGKPVKYFDTAEEAIRWRLANLGITSKNWTRVVKVNKKFIY